MQAKLAEEYLPEGEEVLDLLLISLGTDILNVNCAGSRHGDMCRGL
jgi:hypothetical protein